MYIYKYLYLKRKKKESNTHKIKYSKTLKLGFNVKQLKISKLCFLEQVLLYLMQFAHRKHLLYILFISFNFAQYVFSLLCIFLFLFLPKSIKYVQLFCIILTFVHWKKFQHFHFYFRIMYYYMYFS